MVKKKIIVTWLFNNINFECAYKKYKLKVQKIHDAISNLMQFLNLE